MAFSALTAGAETPACASAARQLQTAQAAVDRDRQAIRALRFDYNVDALDEWLRLDEDARFRRNLATVGALLSAATASVKAGKSLTPPQANRAISGLRDSGYYLPSLERTLRAVAATPNKPIAGYAALGLLKELDQARSSLSIVTTASTRDRGLKVLSAILGEAQTSPQLALLAADVSFATSSVYATSVGLLHEEAISELTKRSVADLTALNKLSTQLASDVQRLGAARSRMTSPGCTVPTSAGRAPAVAKPVSPDGGVTGTWIGSACGAEVAILQISRKSSSTILEGSIAVVVPPADDDELKDNALNTRFGDAPFIDGLAPPVSRRKEEAPACRRLGSGAQSKKSPPQRLQAVLLDGPRLRLAWASGASSAQLRLVNPLLMEGVVAVPLLEGLVVSFTKSR